ncbi:MAG: TolC family protein [Planctomycetes bacterium]|nr:TolC family protein [Planctomycetota bacterium]MCH7602948.1 TolC family protein [Planctomycetota bacterium]
MFCKFLTVVPAIAMAVSPAGCSSPFDGFTNGLDSNTRLIEQSIAREWKRDTTDPRNQGFSTVESLESPDAPATTSQPDDSSTLDDFLIIAALNNPQLEAAFANWKAALERLPQVRSLPDPRFTYGVFINEVETRVGPQQHRIAVAQMFPWFGKLDLKEGIASKLADAAYEAYQSVKLDVFQGVRDAYYQRAGLEREIQVTRENIELIRQLERTARARLRVATAKHPDVIRLQIELEKLSDHLLSLEDMRHPINAKLNAALNRDSSESLSGSFELPRERLGASDQEVLKALRQNNPKLKALDHQMESGRLATRLAKLAERPDVTIGLDYIVTDEALNPSINESGDDPLVASFSINLPIWHEKYEAGVREAIARRYAIVREKKNLDNTLTSRIQTTLYEYRDAQRQISLYRDTLLPKAMQSLESTLVSYQTGESSFLDLLEAQRDLLAFELVLIRGQTSRARELARLDQIAGIRLARVNDESPQHEMNTQ